jgi:uncharacterized membrane protein
MKNKKAQYGINVVIAVALGLFTLLLIAVAVIAGATAITNSNILTGTALAQTQGMTSNLSQGVASFFGNSGTFFSILAVVVIMIFLGLMIGAVYLFTRGKQEKGL